MSERRKPHRGQELFTERVQAQRAAEAKLNSRGLRHTCHLCHRYADDSDLRTEPTDGEIYFVHRGPCP